MFAVRSLALFRLLQLRHMLSSIVSTDPLKPLAQAIFLELRKNAGSNDKLDLQTLNEYFQHIAICIRGGFFEDFEKKLVRENKQQLFIAINAINGTKAGLGGSYLASIISSFNNSIRLNWQQPQRFNQTPVIEVTASNWFNTYLFYPFL